jgi:hypothetical protein
MPEIDGVLRPLTSALRADGYETTVELRDGNISIQITAGPEACEECLSPPAVLTPLFQDLLRRNGHPEQVELSYPPGWKGPEHG